MKISPIAFGKDRILQKRSNNLNPLNNKRQVHLKINKNPNSNLFDL